MNPIELGKFIASLRNEKNLTQEELAEMLYIDKRKISRWECGNSIPEFEMLIKLSEILDVSLYELSICQRVQDDTLTRRILNKFKSIKDFKRYKLKKKLKIILLIIFFILFIITATYTIKNNDTVEIYKIESIDENYHFNGNYIQTEDFNVFYIKQFSNKLDNQEDVIPNFDSCTYDVYDGRIRVLQIVNKNDNHTNSNYKKLHNEIGEKITLDNKLKLNINCSKKEKKYTYSFDVKLTKIYDNKLF